MGIRFSEEQEQVITLRNRNILVSAAAGSGKTTVLVERIIRLISDEKNPVDIDHLLIVTFTKAAAASMREKISEAIEKRLEEHYSDHLKHQATLLHHAQITTIDSFCLFILQNNFNDIGLDPGFRVADEGEMRLLKEDVMQKLLEERLQQDKTEEFAHLLDRFVSANRIAALSDILFRFYDKALSYPFPEDWLTERKKDYDAVGEKKFAASFWMQQLFIMAKRDLLLCKNIAQENAETCKEADGPINYLPMMESDLAQAEFLLQSTSFLEMHTRMQQIAFAVLSRKKDADADPDKKEHVKKQRDLMKKLFKDLKEDFFSYSVEEMLTGFAENDRIIKELCDTVLDFHTRLMEVKKEKKLIDFSDMEHFALQILLQKENGNYVPTKTALEYRKYFHEIMIDEYQDSNLVQEWLLQAVSGEEEGKYNRFMVGDVKQSIYQFRLARPQIFMEKYDTYEKEIREDTKLQRIDLSKNYRSRNEVIEGVNSLFYRIMGRDLGKVSYDADSALYPGTSYPFKENSQDQMELNLVLKEEGDLDKKEQEAKAVAYRIRQLVGKYEVDDGNGGFRKAGFGDIVVLLRNLKGWDEAFQSVFEEEGIPLHVTRSTGYFSAAEVRTLLNFLKALDNPKQDIPLFGVMTSWFGKFTDEEMAHIRGEKTQCLYDSLVLYAGKDEKCRQFLNWFLSYRRCVAYEPIHKILRNVLNESGYLYEVASLPGGTQRAANVQMLLTKAENFEKSSYSGLFHFIRYIEKIQKYDVEFGEAGTQGEGTDAVRLMTIHKSKGLEFPICFVSGCSQAFNMRDTESTFVCNFDYGVGLDYVDLINRIKYKDIRKRFLVRYMQEESLGEELRVLYVAMTRAKEKLILTGFCKDEGMIPDLEGKDINGEKLLPLYKRLYAKSYLDWILLAASPLIKVSTITTQVMEEEALQSVVRQQGEKQKLFAAMEKEETDTALEKEISFSYAHLDLDGLFTKTSVSELKMASMQKAYEKQSMEEQPVSLFPTEEITPYIPKFAKESREISGALRGSAYHRLLELWDFAGEKEKTGTRADVLTIQKQMEHWAEQGYMTEEEIHMINPDKIAVFLRSKIAQRMKNAAGRKELYREQPFVLGVEASRLSDHFPADEKVLVQGIIDVYFMEDGKIVLLDYKTDAVSDGRELQKRYQTQIDYYTEALEKITGYQVKEKILYSFALGDVVTL